MRAIYCIMSARTLLDGIQYQSRDTVRVQEQGRDAVRVMVLVNVIAGFGVVIYSSYRV